MSKKDTQIYRQCRLEKQLSETGKLYTIAWIPAYGAKQGKIIGLKKDNGEYDNGWTVVEIGSSIKHIDDLELQRDAQKRWENVLK